MLRIVLDLAALIFELEIFGIKYSIHFTRVYFLKIIFPVLIKRKICIQNTDRCLITQACGINFSFEFS